MCMHIDIKTYWCTCVGAWVGACVVVSRRVYTFVDMCNKSHRLRMCVCVVY